MCDDGDKRQYVNKLTLLSMSEIYFCTYLICLLSVSRHYDCSHINSILCRYLVQAYSRVINTKQYKNKCSNISTLTLVMKNKYLSNTQKQKFRYFNINLIKSYGSFMIENIISFCNTDLNYFFRKYLTTITF